MGNKLKNQKAKLKLRQDDFDEMREKQGFKRPGSMNAHKQQTAGTAGHKRK